MSSERRRSKRKRSNPPNREDGDVYELVAEPVGENAAEDVAVQTKASLQLEPWKEHILKSAKLREENRFDPTNPLAENAQNIYFHTVSRTFTPLLAALRKAMKGNFDKFAWPVATDEHYTADGNLLLARLSTAIADAGVAFYQVEEQQAEAMEKAKQIVHATVPENAHAAGSNRYLQGGNKLAVVAFEQRQITDNTGMRPSARLHMRITECMELYYKRDNNGGEGGSSSGGKQREDVAITMQYHSPYTSIVGPSGSGKTFTVKHLAEHEGVWVLYTSLSESPTSVPRAGPFVNDVTGNNNAESMHSFWVRYIKAGRHLVTAAGRNGITPGMLFRMLYLDEYSAFRKNFAEAVRKLDQFKSKTIPNKFASLFGAQEIQALRQWDERVQTSKPIGYRRFSRDHSQQSVPIIYCFDEARTLLHEHKLPDIQEEQAGVPIGFRQLRRALHQEGSSHPLFGLLLDTSSRVANFSPPETRDPSAKTTEGFVLFPPLYGVYVSWDGMTRQSEDIQQWLKTVIVKDDQGVSYVKEGPKHTVEWRRFLYSLGRPLWGAVMNAAQSKSDSRNGSGDDSGAEDRTSSLRKGIRAVEDIVLYKLSARSDELQRTKEQRLAALLLFRLQFYVSDHRLSEACVADWMHYVRHVSLDRTTIQTLPTAEPTLARFVLAQMMSGEVRRAMTDCLVNLLHHGALNEGDHGEIIAGWLLLLAIDETKEDEDEDGNFKLYKSLGGFLRHFLFELDPVQVPLLSESYIHVTHISRLCTDSGLITQRHLQVGFLAGAAFYLPRGFCGIDILVPVWQGPNRPMTALIVQVKNVKDGDRMNPKTKNSACDTLAVGRRNVDALRLSNQCVYGLYVNLRPTPSGGIDSGSLHENPYDPQQDNIYMFYKMGFSHGAYSYLSADEAMALKGVLETHLFGRADVDTEAIGQIVVTRDGSTFFYE